MTSLTDSGYRYTRLDEPSSSAEFFADTLQKQQVYSQVYLQIFANCNRIFPRFGKEVPVHEVLKAVTDIFVNSFF